ncbi:lipopolysaccharide biosynthesis protein [Listeria fleischmannii]|jgi:O-antigen/teichoic acid export membrane protein|uniref:Oligosaccharide flippase family protein n=1 Tax=Listeria fleischmannii TaxID=1069827 RepID=A0A841YF13_9LIST|nr:oligosaccharide flippase family protein [Listeria fleischmannii]MBC1398708.1 oligosaccharide flippase family protein [Listeria fleischmannii]MBC1418175.1 oligosaccharide flippase family protein [Listeria fleischmannii]MBC1426948.1 oligosaccharide flippase family protein [Listeria fleischmannii]STY35947.1 O-antigen translocase [Listeria fleischmannii subsp. coloradonensis]
MKTLIKRLMQFAIGSLGSAFLNLLTIPVVTYFISPAEYGKTSMFMLAQTLLICVIYLGFDQAFAREFYDYADKNKLFRTAIFIPLLFSIFVITMMCIFAKPLSIFLFDSDNYYHAIYLIACSTLFLIFERFIFLHIRMQNKALEFSLFNILVKFMILLCTVLFLIMFSHTFITVVYATIIGQMIGDSILIIRNYRLLQFNWLKIDRDLLPKLARFGLPVVVATVIYSLFVIIDKLFIRYFCDFEQLGLYTAAFKIASALLILQTTFSNFWVPTAYEWYKKQKPMRYFKLVSDSIMFVIALLFTGLLLFKGLIMMILSPGYAEAQYIFPFLCFYPLMMTVSETTNLGIVFLKKSWLNILVSIIALVVSVGLNVLLVPRYGAIGASIATGSAYIAFFLARTYFSMKIWKGFSVKRHMITTSLLFVVAALNIVIHTVWLITMINLVLLACITFIYIPIVLTVLRSLREKRQQSLGQEKGMEI